jgi:hypothetical protein
MIPNFYIIGSKTERPDSRKTIFTDGSPDDTFRINTDIELSHWIPNRTEAKYKADTSTEICMNFILEESPDEWDLAINNHLDVDGILSVFTLVHSDFSIKNRDVIIEAAEMGDFWAWGNTDSQKLFQGLTYFMNELRIDKVDIQDIYSQVRNRLDKEKVQLVSVETKSGWYYDLWYPAYTWADTSNLWRAPGFEFTEYKCLLLRI